MKAKYLIFPAAAALLAGVALWCISLSGTRPPIVAGNIVGTSSTQTEIPNSESMFLDARLGIQHGDPNDPARIQDFVDQGGFPWRLNSENTLIATLAPDGLASQDAFIQTIQAVSFNAQKGLAVYSLVADGKKYLVTVSQPVIGKNKIWIVSDIERVPQGK